MIVSFLLLLLVAFIPVSAGTCRCLLQTKCDQPDGCQFKCQPGFAGENCRYDNLGYKSRARGRKLLDGNYNTCISIRTLQIRRFNTPRNINTVRIHRRKGRRAGGNVYLYVEKKQIKTWLLPGFKKNSYRDILTLKFPVVDGATSATIGSVRSACEIEFTNESDTERVECTEDSCSGKGRCSIADGKPVCECETGFKGPRCDIGCQSGSYGINCSSNCSAGCNDSCDSVDGSCDCKPGFTGDKCDNPCSSGSYGINCSSDCSTGCRDSCDSVDGSCDCKPGFTGAKCEHSCQSGSYGINCSSNCSAGCSDSCDSVDGSCDCKPGFTGDKCDNRNYGINCSSNCSSGCSDSCDSVDGSCDCKPGFTGDKCDNPCQSGSYGIKCSSNCSVGCSDSCDSVDGSCDCKPGFTGDKCDNQCRKGFYGHGCNKTCEPQCLMCDHMTGSCKSKCTSGWYGENCDRGCPLGFYGDGCAQTCREGCQPERCDAVHGTCTSPCNSGWRGDNCSRRCDSNRYGEDCALNCSEGCVHSSCDPENGECEECKPGWQHGNLSRRCDKRCSTGFYGKGCMSICSEGCVFGMCSSVDGTCGPPCKEDWTGSSCLIKIIYCPAAEYNTTVGVFNISKTPVGRTFSTPELCHVDGQPLGEVNCSADEQGGGNWSSFTTNRACDYSDLDDSDISDTLTGFLKDNEDIEKVIHATVNISRNMTLNKLDLLLVTDIMERTRNLSEVSRQFAEGVLTMYDKIIEVPESTLTDLQERAASSNRILRSVDDITGKIQPGPTGTERVSTETFVCQVWDLNNPSVTSNNLHFGLVLSASDDNQTSSLDPMNNKSVEYSQSYEAVLLPQSLLVNLQNGSEGKDIRMSMNIYKDPLLFTKASTTEASYLLNSKVVAAKIVVNGEEISDLGADSLTMIFSQPKVDTDVARTCGYWNFSLSGWSTDGCEFSQGESGLGECTCDHLTNFAILLDLEGNADRSSVHSLPLSVITTLGLSLSILGLSGTLLSFIVFKKLREKHPQQTLFNLALAELCAWVVFLAGITQTQSYAGCTLVAILLHYFLLASFMWMLAEAFLHYLLLVKVQAQGAFTNRYMLKTGLPAWGLPLLPVLIVLAVDPGLYRGSDSHCWMSLSASLYAFALPVGIIILFNIIIYIKVVINIFRMSKAQAGATKGNKKRQLLKIRVPILCFILFGLSWTFGFLAVSEAQVVFQYLFCLTSSSQGFFIFIFFTARNEEVRQLWGRLCHMKKRHLISVGKKDISTSIMTTKTTGDIETSV